MLPYTKCIEKLLVMVTQNTKRKERPNPKDLAVFLAVIRKKSFAGAAEELGQSPAYVSKRIGILEANLQTRLFHRSTRSVVLTDDGDRTQRWALRILEDMDDMIDDLSQAQHIPRGHLQICSTFGFGRRMVAPALSKLSTQNPELEIRLEVFDREVDLVQEGFDMELRVGEDLPQQHICKNIKSNNRILCASPEYLKKHGTPESIEELKKHSCLILRERNAPFGIWKVERDGKPVTATVHGTLSSNHGEIVAHWAKSGHGIAMRSMWDVEPLISTGELVQVLPEYTQTANIWAVYPTRLSHSAKLRVCVEFLAESFNHS